MTSQSLDLVIRGATEADFPRIWEIFQAVVGPGDTYALSPETTREEARSYWMSPDARAYVAESAGRIEGTYLLKRNQPGLGSHVGNAAYMVDPGARARGIGKRMGEHSLAEAKKLGYLAIQFNFVVSTNHAAVELWKKLGFAIIGTSPRAYRHARLGLVDAYIMHRSLE